VKEEASVKIRNAIKHLEQGNYDDAMEENAMALNLFPHIPVGDEALFNMGLIHAHHKNPRKDYKKSLSFFERLLRDYPESSLAEQARIWVGVLLTIEKSKEVDIRIQEMKKELLR
jgi:TolA-binding protein